MNFRLTLSVLGWLLLFMGGVLLFPILFSLWFEDGEVMNFLASAVITADVQQHAQTRGSSTVPAPTDSPTSAVRSVMSPEP